MFLEGMNFGPHYKLLHRISHGGEGDIYTARETYERHQRDVAIKVVQINDAETERRFRRETIAIANLKHPHIVSLFVWGEQPLQNGRGDYPKLGYLVMPYYEEGSLKDWLEKQERNKRSLSPIEVGNLLDQMAQALQYAHNNNVIHRDIKPPNFLIQDIGNPGLPHLMLADFGIATFNTGISTNLRGTDRYIAPEQWEGKSPSKESDQYALAVTTYELLTGRHPFLGPTLPNFMLQHITARPEPPSKLNTTINSEIDEGDAAYLSLLGVG